MKLGVSETTSLPQHSSKSVEHFTPAAVVEAARLTMGSITLDPASCAQANETVKAQRYFDQAMDGLSLSWMEERVFLNPPGGKTNGKSNSSVWWNKLVSEGVEQAIFIGFSIEFLQTAQGSDVSPLGFPFCIPRRRLQFNTPDGPGTSPTHANVIIYVAPQGAERLEAIGRFQRYFSEIGQVVIPCPL